MVSVNESVEKHVVTVMSRSEKGKSDVVKVPFDDLIGATRFLLTFKPKKGYMVNSWHIDKHWHLF